MFRTKLFCGRLIAKLPFSFTLEYHQDFQNACTVHSGRRKSSANTNQIHEISLVAQFMSLIGCASKNLAWLSPETNQFWSQLNASIKEENEKPFTIQVLLNNSKSYGSLDLSGVESKLLLADPLVADQFNQIPMRTIAVLISSQLFPPAQQLSTRTKIEIEQQQLELGCATEFLYLSQKFHSLAPTNQDEKEDHQFLSSKKTKMATLIGDFFITRSVSSLATIKNSIVFEKMMNSLAELCLEQSPCLKHDSNDDGSLNKSPQTTTVPENELRTSRNINCSLLGNAFLCSALLAGHNLDVQKQAAKVGEILGKVL